MSDMIAALQPLLGKPLPQHPSPFGRWLDGILEKAELGSLTFRFKVREEMRNPLGVLHGGVISGIMDDVIGATLLTSGVYTNFTSINLNVEFIASVKGHEPEVLATTKVVKQGRRTSNVECLLTDDSGKLLAKGHSVLINLEQ